MRPAVLLVLGACSLLSGVAVSPTVARVIGLTLAVDGRSNQTPWAAASGRFVVVAWGAQPAEGGADVFVAVSRDGGETFGAPVQVNREPGTARLGGELPPRVALEPRPGAEVPGIVVAYGARTATGTAIMTARSSDGGRSFEPPRALQASAAAGDRGWHALALDAAGTAHVMWLDHRGLAGGGARDHRQHEADAVDGVAMAERSGLYYARDPGRDARGPAAPPATERELVKGVCYCCKVALATGARGEVFAAWRHVYPGNVRDIAFMASPDGGRTFGPPTRVSADDWHLAGCPDDGPAMAVDGDGVIHVVWPTVVGDQTPEGALFYAASRDGRTFTPRTRIPTLGGRGPCTRRSWPAPMDA